jgi:hypothetical protein
MFVLNKEFIMLKKLLSLFVLMQIPLFCFGNMNISTTIHTLPLKYLMCPFIRHCGAFACFTSAGWLCAEMLRDTYYGVLEMKQQADKTEKIIEMIDQNVYFSAQEKKQAGIIQSISHIPYIFPREWCALWGVIYLTYIGIKLLRI